MMLVTSPRLAEKSHIKNLSSAFASDEALSACAGRRAGLCSRRSDGALEIGVRTGITMDWHMLADIELQPLDVVVERYGVRADIGNRRPRRGRPHIRADENLRLRQIHDR